jgi:hypothetical protein
VPSYRTSNYVQALTQHHHKFFQGHEILASRWPLGPMPSRVPDFFVHEVGPGPRGPFWTYLSFGLWPVTQTEHGHGIEFVMTASVRSERLVELVTMAGYYHAGPPEQRLNLGHTVAIGEPWLPGSVCDHELVSLPYAFGPDLEVCSWRGGHLRVLELLPISEAEYAYKMTHGQEALEQLLEIAGVTTADPARPSVV